MYQATPHHSPIPFGNRFVETARHFPGNHCMTPFFARWRLFAVILWLGAVPNHVVCGDEPDDKRRVPPLFVTMIGGFDSEPTAEQIAATAPRGTGNSGMFQLCGDLKKAGLATEYFNWNGSVAGKLNEQPAPQAAAIAERIRRHHSLRPDDRLAIVGNSWGGHTAWEVAQSLAEEPVVTLDLIVFLDPSSLGRLGKSTPDTLSANVRRAVSFRTRNAFVWKAWPSEPRLENIDLGDPANGYLKKPGPAYDAAFDWQAHIAVEWDGVLHRDVRDRLLKLAKPDDDARPASVK